MKSPKKMSMKNMENQNVVLYVDVVRHFLLLRQKNNNLQLTPKTVAGDDFRFVKWIITEKVVPFLLKFCQNWQYMVKFGINFFY